MAYEVLYSWILDPWTLTSSVCPEGVARLLCALQKAPPPLWMTQIAPRPPFCPGPPHSGTWTSPSAAGPPVVNKGGAPSGQPPRGRAAVKSSGQQCLLVQRPDCPKSASIAETFIFKNQYFKEILTIFGLRSRMRNQKYDFWVFSANKNRLFRQKEDQLRSNFKASALWADVPNVHIFVCLSVCLFVCSLLRYWLMVFLPPLPEVRFPIFLEIRNPWGKKMERTGLIFEHIFLEVV